MIENLAKVLPQLAVIAAVFGIIGWALRGLTIKPTAKPATKASAPSDGGKQDRVKNLEAALEKSRASHKTTKSELETLQAVSVSREVHEASLAELDAARKNIEAAAKRASALETDFKKAQESIKSLNSRANEGEKAQKDRSFALENELSKAREQLAVLENRPDDSANLQTEIERLRESVATTTRYSGELRKREAAAIEALEKLQAQVASQGLAKPAAPAKTIGPVGDSSRVAAAKAEVLRLVELNKQKETAPAPVALPAIAVATVAAREILPEPEVSSEPEPETPPAPVEAAAAIESTDSTVESENESVGAEAEVVAPQDEAVAPEAEAVPEKKSPASGELFALD